MGSQAGISSEKFDPLWQRDGINLTFSLTCLQMGGGIMKPLTQYGRMAEKHWREHCPHLVQTLEATGRLHTMLLEAEEKTKDEMIELTRQFRNQGMSPQQAHDRAWEMVRERYILLPSEATEN
jgi:hypothetical protein